MCFTDFPLKGGCMVMGPKVDILSGKNHWRERHAQCTALTRSIGTTRTRGSEVFTSTVIARSTTAIAAECA